MIVEIKNKKRFIGALILFLLVIGFIGTMFIWSIIRANDFREVFCPNYKSKGVKVKGVVVSYFDPLKKWASFRYKIRIDDKVYDNDIKENVPGFDTLAVDDTIPVIYLPRDPGRYNEYIGSIKDLCGETNN